MSPEELLVVGASGLVGAEVLRSARSRGKRAVGAARSAVGEVTLKVDLSERESVAEAMRALSPTSVVVASAWPHVDGCELDPDRSHRENVVTVRNVVEGASRMPEKPTIVFFSTDHVFDGKKDGTYVEGDPVNPPSVYARHKRDVEELLLGYENTLIVRTAWVFGPEVRKKNFVYRVIDMAARRETLRVPAGQAGCPTFSRWLANATLDLLEQDVRGVVHLTGTELFSKAQWARAIAAALELEGLRVEEMDPSAAGQVAPRPDKVALTSERHSLVQPAAEGLLRLSKAEFI